MVGIPKRIFQPLPIALFDPFPIGGVEYGMEGPVFHEVKERTGERR